MSKQVNHNIIDNSRLSSDTDPNDDRSGINLGVKQRNKYDYFSQSTQGAQGSQMKIESQKDHVNGAKYLKKSSLEEESPDEMGLPKQMPGQLSAFDPNSTQTNALLSIRDNQFNLILQQVYYSEKCSWFYIGLLVLSFGLILVTIFDGFQVAESPMFIILEFVLNLLIGIDFACRIKLVGCSKYVRDPNTRRLRWWNIFDGIVVIVCNSVFAVSLFSKTGAVKGFEEAGEEGLIVMWCIWQTLRMILIAKKQRLARQSAKSLINFENIVVDTDFGGALSFRSMAIDGGRNNLNLSGDPDDIVVEMTDMEKNQADSDEKHHPSNARLRSKINAKPSLTASAAGRFGRVNSQGTKSSEFNNINHYVIDDDDDEDSARDSHDGSVNDNQSSNLQNMNTSNNSSSSQPREIIFSIEDD